MQQLAGQRQPPLMMISTTPRAGGRNTKGLEMIGFSLDDRAKVLVGGGNAAVFEIERRMLLMLRARGRGNGAKDY